MTTRDGRKRMKRIRRLIERQERSGASNPLFGTTYLFERNLKADEVFI